MVEGLSLREGWTTVVLLLLLALCVAWCIQAEQWTPGLQILQEVVLAAGVLGIVAAKSRAPSRMVHSLSLLAGLGWTSWLTSRVVAHAADLSAQAAILELEWRLRVWAYAVVNRQPTSGGTAFLFLLGLLLWLMSYFSAWAVFRWQRVWWAVVACAVPMMVNVTTARGNLTLFLIGFLLVALLLVVRTSLAAYEQEWRRQQVHYSSEVVGSILRVGLVVSALVIGLAWIVPAAVAGEGVQEAWRKVSEPWHRIQRAWSDSFQDLNYRNPAPIVERRRGSLFSGPPNLTDRPIMDLQASTGLYWRERVFDAYRGYGWWNTDPDTVLLEAQDPRLSPASRYERQAVVTQTVTLRHDMTFNETLVTAGQPLTVSVPVEAQVRWLIAPEAVETSSAAQAAEIGPDGPSWLYPQQLLRAGETYTVASSVSVADAEALSQAGDDYPPWVVDRYLALPDSLPDRVRAKAEEIAGGLPTPLDKARAIETYLRQLPYNDQIPGPAPDQDGVDYFLFEEKQGYCQYYASAMVVMLRVVGVPARYVEGYVPGSLERGVYHVLEKDGHAWAEVFFPGLGWIRFEPTPSQPVNALTRPARAEQEREEAERLGDQALRRERFLEDDGMPNLPSSVPVRLPLWRRAGRWLWPALGVVLLGAAGSGLLMLRRRRRIAGLTAAERVFQDLEAWAGRLLRLRLLPHQTPHEYAATVSDRVPRGRAVVGRIADLFVEERFGGRAAPGEEAEAAWRQARRALWGRWLEGAGERLRARRGRSVARP